MMHARQTGSTSSLENSSTRDPQMSEIGNSGTSHNGANFATEQLDELEVFYEDQLAKLERANAKLRRQRQTFAQQVEDDAYYITSMEEEKKRSRVMLMAGTLLFLVGLVMFLVGLCFLWAAVPFPPSFGSPTSSSAISAGGTMSEDSGGNSSKTSSSRFRVFSVFFQLSSASLRHLIALGGSVFSSFYTLNNILSQPEVPPAGVVNEDVVHGSSSAGPEATDTGSILDYNNSLSSSSTSATGVVVLHDMWASAAGIFLQRYLIAAILSAIQYVVYVLCELPQDALLSCGKLGLASLSFLARRGIDALVLLTVGLEDSGEMKDETNKILNHFDPARADTIISSSAANRAPGPDHPSAVLLKSFVSAEKEMRRLSMQSADSLIRRFDADMVLQNSRRMCESLLSSHALSGHQDAGVGASEERRVTLNKYCAMVDRDLHVSKKSSSAAFDFAALVVVGFLGGLMSLLLTAWCLYCCGFLSFVTRTLPLVGSSGSSCTRKDKDPKDVGERGQFLSSIQEEDSCEYEDFSSEKATSDESFKAGGGEFVSTRSCGDSVSTRSCGNTTSRSSLNRISTQSDFFTNNLVTRCMGALLENFCNYTTLAALLSLFLFWSSYRAGVVLPIFMWLLCSLAAWESTLPKTDDKCAAFDSTMMGSMGPAGGAAGLLSAQAVPATTEAVEVPQHEEVVLQSRYTNLHSQHHHDHLQPQHDARAGARRPTAFSSDHMNHGNNTTVHHNQGRSSQEKKNSQVGAGGGSSLKYKNGRSPRARPPDEEVLQQRNYNCTRSGDTLSSSTAAVLSTTSFGSSMQNVVDDHHLINRNSVPRAGMPQSGIGSTDGAPVRLHKDSPGYLPVATAPSRDYPRVSNKNGTSTQALRGKNREINADNDGQALGGPATEGSSRTAATQEGVKRHADEIQNPATHRKRNSFFFWG